MSLTSENFENKVKKILIAKDLIKTEFLYTIIIDGGFLTSSGYYGNERNIQGFKTKELAQKEIDSFYSDRNIKIKKVKVKKVF